MTNGMLTMRNSLSKLVSVSLLGLVVTLCTLFALTETANAWTLKVIHSFCNADHQCPDGHTPGALIESNGGDLFGTLADGGQNGLGSVFELIPNADRSQWKFKTIYSFQDGATPSRGLIIDAAGNLYGGTGTGGSGSGLIYRLSPAGKYTVLYALCPEGGTCDDGVEPARLTYAGESKGTPYDGSSPLYGLTAGGAFQYGNVFKLERGRHDSWKYTVLHAFCSENKCADGRFPDALIANSDGSLFGTALVGGEKGRGVIFSLSHADKHRWSESIIYNFCQTKTCEDGAQPTSLSSTSDGKLVGTARNSGPNCEGLHNHRQCGVLFQVNADGTGYSVLHGFCAASGCADGKVPFDALETQPADIAGVTFSGGAHDLGTVFGFQNGSFESIYQFCSQDKCADGSMPWTELTADSSGSLFGTTREGGAYGYGEVFELSP